MSELFPQSDQRELQLPERQLSTIDLGQVAATLGANPLHIAVEVYTLDDFTSHEEDIKEYFTRKYGKDEWTRRIVKIGDVEYVFFVSTEEGKSHLVEKIAHHVVGPASVRLGFESPSPREPVDSTTPPAAILPPPVSSYPKPQPDARLKAYDTTPDKKPTLDATA